MKWRIEEKEVDECRTIPEQIIFTNDEKAFMDCVAKIENFMNKE